MIVSKLAHPSKGADADRERGSDVHAPVSTLRASAKVDAPLAVRVIVGICLVSLAVAAASLFVAGADKNAQINELREHGVPVQITVSRCIALLGGSGSNGAGYACIGTYTASGHRYVEPIPGDTLHAPGAKLAGIASPNVPGLVSTAADVALERANFRVFVLPTALVVAFGLVVAALGFRFGSRLLMVRRLRAKP